MPSNVLMCKKKSEGGEASLFFPEREETVRVTGFVFGLKDGKKIM